MNDHLTTIYNRRINRLTVEIEQQTENIYEKRQKLETLLYWQMAKMDKKSWACQDG